MVQGRINESQQTIACFSQCMNTGDIRAQIVVGLKHKRLNVQESRLSSPSYIFL